MKSLILLVLLFISSCAKEEPKVVEIKDFEVSYAPSSTFGVVRIGERKYSGFRIKNNTNNKIKISYEEPSEPFVITDRGCLDELDAKSECIVEILYIPGRGISHEDTINVMGETLTFTGKALRDSEIELENIYWDAGNIEAGEVAVHEVKIFNVSDNILSPPKTNTPNYFILSHTCREEILPDTNCTAKVGVQKTVVGEYDEQFAIFTNETPERYATFKATVGPSFASGNIPITCGKSSLIANNVDETTCEAGPIKDDFGNIVKENTIVNASTNHLYLDTKVIDYTKEGIVNFKIRSSSTNKPAKLILSTGRASGTSDIRLVSGPPVGEIKFRSHQEQISADGNSYIVLETFPMYNSSGVGLTDGTEIEVIIDGSGIDISPHHFSIDGALKVYVKASTVADLNTITVRANPKTVNGQTTYLAQGQTTLKFAPLSKIGDANIDCDYSSILKGTDISTDNQTQTNCTISEVKDIHGNLVGNDTEIFITINNGVNLADSNSFTLATNSESSASFGLKGVGQRGEIKITANIGEIERSHSVYAVDQLNITHSYYDRNIDLYFLYTENTRDVYSVAMDEWNKYHGEYYDIQALDSYSFGIERYLGGETSSIATIRDLGQDCFVGVRNYVVISPCTEIVVNSGSFDYKFGVPNKIGPLDSDFETNGITQDYANYLGNKLMGSVYFYDNYQNRIHIYGGTYLEDVSSGVYRLRPNVDAITYSNITLFNNMFLNYADYTYIDKYPMFKGYHKGSSKSFLFGGIGFIADEEGIEHLQYSSELTMLENSDLTLISVIGDSPSARFLPGLFYDEQRNKVYLFGGIDSNKVILNDIWVIDLNNESPSWVKLGEGYDLALNYNHATYLINLLNSQGESFISYVSSISFETYRNIVEDVFPPKISYYDNKIYISEFEGTSVREFDLTTNTLSENTDFDFLVGKKTFYNSSNNRTYILTEGTPGQFDSKLSYIDSFKGNTLLYRTSIKIEEYSYQHAIEITPEVSATAQSDMFNTLSAGLKAYIYNYALNSWELLGEHNNDASIIESSFISKTYNNPKDYFSPDRTVEIMLEPGFQAGVFQGELFDSHIKWYINSIRLRGEF